MKNEDCKTDCCHSKNGCKNHHGHVRGDSGAIYGLGVVGALFYFLKDAPTFGAVLFGIGKAVFWPAILMYQLLTFLQL